MDIWTKLKGRQRFNEFSFKTNGQSGEGTIYADDHTIGPLSCTFDATTTHGNPALVAFIGGEHAIYWTEKTVSGVPINSFNPFGAFNPFQ